jgi:hypothetical protein
LLNYVGHIGKKLVYEANGPLDYMDDILICTERVVREVRTEVLIPQVRPARTYSISPWEMIHLSREIAQ